MGKVWRLGRGVAVVAGGWVLAFALYVFLPAGMATTFSAVVGLGRSR